MTNPQPRARTRTVSTLDNPQSEAAQIMAQIAKVRGPAVVRRADLLVPWTYTPTGVFSVDAAFLGGMPEGAVTYGKGWQHSGKSTMGYRALGQSQKKHRAHGGVAMLVDVEGMYMPAWGAVHGIDNTELILSQPNSGEEALDVTIAMIKAQEVQMIMVDSLAGLMPQQVKDKSFEDAVVGRQALMISRFCSVLQSELIDQRRRGHNVAIYLVNQFRYKIGVTHGDPRTTPGGVAAGYVASLEVEWKNRELLDATADMKKLHDGANSADKMVDHNDHAFTMKKNKMGNGPREGEFMMIRNPEHPLGQGFIDDAKQVVTWAKAHGSVTGGGGAYRIRNCDTKFARLQDIADHLYGDLDFYENTKRELIEDFRESQGLIRNFM